MGRPDDGSKKAGQTIREQRGPGGYEVVAGKTRDLDIDPRIIAFYGPDSPVAEQYRTLRTNLLAAGTRKRVNCVVVTSSTHGEGKSITAVNLAVSLANDPDHRRVLLVDGDLRRANVHKYLGMGPQAGLAEVLAGVVPAQATLRGSGIEGLTVLGAGGTVRNPAELLGSQAFAQMLKSLRETFDFIIFDSPPVIPVTDAGLISSRCDGALVVVQAGRTPRGVVRHCTSLLRQAQSRVLGYVITNVRHHIPAYIYRYL